MTMKINRRTVLRGAVNGAAVAVALPILDCLLNSNGTAYAAGAPLPVRFGTWHWGCGINPTRWIPQKVGADYDIPPELKGIEAFKNQISVLSGFNAVTDGRPNLVHHSGLMCLRTGVAPVAQNVVEAPTFDTLIAAKIGEGTRFRSLEIAATGNPRDSYSRPGPDEINPAEGSALSFYTRLFGADFRDPNAADFKPDPRVLLSKSALSAVAEQRKAMMAGLGSADRARMDQYFTSIRQIEQQLALQLERPAPLKACAIPEKPTDNAPTPDINQVEAKHKLMANLLAMAVACNQTKVFNMVFSPGTSTLQRTGNPFDHHRLTHTEPSDGKLGYQVEAGWFIERSMAALGTFLEAFAAISEGDGTLLDNSLILAHSDTQIAKIHSIDGMPALLAGKGGGRVKTGLHVAGKGDPVTRIGYSLQQFYGLPIESYGSGSMKTSKTISEIFA